MSLNVAILEYLSQYVRKQPADVDIEGVEIALNSLAEALNLDLATISSSPGALSSHNYSLQAIFDAGLKSLDIQPESLEGPSVGTFDHLQNYLATLRKKNFFALVEEGSPEYYSRLDAAILEYSKSHDLDLAKVQEHLQLSEQIQTEAEDLKNQGNKLLSSGEYQSAIAKYTQAIIKNPRNHIFWLNRAVALHKLNNLDRAVLDAERSTILSPTYLKAHYRLGLLRKELGDYKSAQASLQAAYDLAQDDDTRSDIQQHLQANEDSKTKSQANASALKKPAAKKKKTSNGGAGGLDLASLMNNPMLQNMAASMLGGQGGQGGQGGGLDLASLMNNPMVQNMMSNPQMQNMMANMMGGGSAPEEDEE